MHRLGNANWWYPRFLEKITPHVSIDPPGEVALPPNSTTRAASAAQTWFATGNRFGIE